MRIPKERKSCKKLRLALADVEKRLPALKKKAIDSQSKIENLEKRLLELERELTDAEAKCKALEAEIEKSVAELNSQLDSSWARFCYKVQRKWNESKMGFMAMVILLVTMLAFIIVTIFYQQDVKLGLLTLTIGSSLAFLFLGIRYKKYRWLLGWAIVAFLLLVISVYTTNAEVQWNYRFLGLTVLTIGFAIQTFFSGEYVEKKLDDINKKISSSEK